MRKIAVVVLVVLAACGGGAKSRSVSQETSCDKLSARLVHAYDATGSGSPEWQEVVNRMKELGCQ